MAEHAGSPAAADPALSRVHILDLPPAQYIMRFLGERADFEHCALVCKPWRQAVGAVFYIGKEDLEDEAVRVLAEERRFLHIVQLGACERLTATAVEHLARCCPELRSIELPTWSDDSDEAVDDLEFWDTIAKHLARGCPKLNSVDFSNTSLTDEGVRCLAQGCRGLQDVDLSFCEELTHEALRHLAEGCPDLRRLDLSRCAMSSNAAQHIAQHCHMLEDFASYPSIGDDGVREIVRGCPRLKHLDLYECVSISDEAAKHLADGCAGLLTVLFSGQFLTDEAAKHLARGCGKLSKVGYCNLDGISDATAKYLSRCADLRDVTLHLVGPLTKRTAEYLARGCRKLERVEFSCCGVPADDAARYFASGCPELCSLELEGCGHLTAKTRGLLEVGCPLLRNLEVKEGMGWGDDGHQGVEHEGWCD